MSDLREYRRAKSENVTQPEIRRHRPSGFPCTHIERRRMKCNKCPQYYVVREYKYWPEREDPPEPQPETKTLPRAADPPLTKTPKQQLTRTRNPFLQAPANQELAFAAGPADSVFTAMVSSSCSCGLEAAFMAIAAAEFATVTPPAENAKRHKPRAAPLQI